MVMEKKEVSALKSERDWDSIQIKHLLRKGRNYLKAGTHSFCFFIISIFSNEVRLTLNSSFLLEIRIPQKFGESDIGAAIDRDEPDDIRLLF